MPDYGPMVILRPATAHDSAFLHDMLVVAADWRADSPQRTVAEAMRDPALAHYVADWPREGDVGVVAEAATPVGAAWWRFFPADDPGYGFVNAGTPEISVGLQKAFRGQGLGTLLLEALIAHALRVHVPALSLSVESDNGAVRLYRHLGFEVVADADGSLTMLLDLTA